MTPARSDRATVRLSASIYRGREIVVELLATHMLLRLKGTRDRVMVPYAAALDLGYKLRARQALAERKERKRK